MWGGGDAFWRGAMEPVYILDGGLGHGRHVGIIVWKAAVIVRKWKNCLHLRVVHTCMPS